MKRIPVIITIVSVPCLLFANIVYSASLSDMFGGKKKQEQQQQLIKQKEQECQVLIRQKDQDIQKLKDQYKDSDDSIQELRDKNSTLVEAYEKIVSDQGNITEQLSRLRRFKQSCEKIKGNYDQMTQESEAFLQENQSLEQDIKILKITLDNLKSHIGDLNTDNEKLTVFLKEAQEDEDVKVKKIREKVKNEISTLKRQNISLNNENDTLSNLLVEFEKKALILEANNLKASEKEDLLQGDLTALEKDYAAVTDENRYLTREVSELPKKFTDLARHNRKLVKETAHMHYNMGVSFIKANEFKRAVKEFKKVLELDPNDAHANYNLGYIYAEHLVDRPMAVRHFQSYLAHANDDKDADWVKRYILTWQTWYGREKMK